MYNGKLDNVSGINTVNVESSVDVISQFNSIYSNIIVNGLTICGKQDTGAELNAMPRCIYDRLAETDVIPVEPCTNTQINGYGQSAIDCVGTVQLGCTHRDITKKMKFYITDVVDDKLILGLDFCKTFQLISVHCDSNYPCKANVKSLYEVEFPIGLSVPNDEKQGMMTPPPPVDINTKLKPDTKAHVMELFPELFDGLGTMKDAMVHLDVNPSVTPVVQPPRKVPQAMVQPLKDEIDRMLQLGVIRKLDINQATDWCHNLVLVRKPNGKLRVCLDPRSINKALRFNVHS